MFQGGRWIAFALVAAMIATAGSALATLPPLPPVPTLPPIGVPGPPSSLGRCVGAAQDGANAVTGAVAPARDLGLLAADQASQGTGDLLTGIPLPVANGEAMNATILSAIRGIQFLANNTADMSNVMARAISASLNDSLGALPAMIQTDVPGLVDQTNQTLNWTNRFEDASVVQPLIVFFKAGGTDPDFYSGWATAFLAGLTGAPAPPTAPAYGMIAGAGDAGTPALQSMATLGDAASANVASAQGVANGFGIAATPLADAIQAQVLEMPAAAQLWGGEMTAFANHDAGALQGMGPAAIAALSAEAGVLPGAVVGCPGS
jgi:hypothetical protein